MIPRQVCSSYYQIMELGFERFRFKEASNLRELFIIEKKMAQCRLLRKQIMRELLYQICWLYIYPKI